MHGVMMYSISNHYITSICIVREYNCKSFLHQSATTVHEGCMFVAYIYISVLKNFPFSGSLELDATQESPLTQPAMVPAPD